MESWGDSAPEPELSQTDCEIYTERETECEKIRLQQVEQDSENSDENGDEKKGERRFEFLEPALTFSGRTKSQSRLGPCKVISWTKAEDGEKEGGEDLLDPVFQHPFSFRSTF